MGGLGMPLAGAAAGVAEESEGDWALAGVASVPLPESTEDWDSAEEGAAAVDLAILFNFLFSFLSFFFFLRSFFSFFFSFLRRLAYSGSSLATAVSPSGPEGRLRSSSSSSSSSDSDSGSSSSRAITSGAQPSLCSLAMRASKSSVSLGGL